MATKTRLKHGLLGLAQHLNIFPLLQRRHEIPGQAVYVLTYHRVDVPDAKPWLDPAHISASPEMFEAHMRLISNKYHPVTMEEVLTAAQNGSPLPDNAVLVTVDDAYLDFKEIIYPIARQYGVQLTLFIPTAYVGKACFFWWDKLYQAVFYARESPLKTPIGLLMVETPEEKRMAVSKLARYVKSQPAGIARELVETLYAHSQPPFTPRVCTLSWETLRSLSQSGVTIAAHTHTHPVLTRVNAAQACKEIRISQKMIARHIGHTLPVFAYPDGKQDAFNTAVQDALRMEGFQLAFTMMDGGADFTRHNPLLLPRIGIWSRMTLAQLHWRLTRY